MLFYQGLNIKLIKLIKLIYIFDKSKANIII